MPQAFISHSHKDNDIVLAAANHLRSSLVKVWIDETQIPTGAILVEKIFSGIKQSAYFYAFISQDYVQSDWCIDELEKAYSLSQKHKVRMIPVLLTPRSKLDLSGLHAERKDFVEAFLSGAKYLQFDHNNLSESLAAVANALWDNETVKIAPIKIETIGGIQMQRIQFRLGQTLLPSDFLRNWDFDIAEFISEHDDDHKPIQKGLPVAFYGISINWLITYLTIPFKNMRTVFVYNSKFDDWVCVYALQDGNYVGKVVK